MKLIRVGDKVISWDKVSSALAEILQRRSNGATQQEVATDFGIERTFISYLEGIGAIRKGKRVALLGFPVANKRAVKKVAQECGVEFIKLLSEKERRDFIRKKSEAAMFNDVINVLAELKEYDTVVVLASDKRLTAVERILDQEVIAFPIGSSPITEDRTIDTDELRRVLLSLIVDDETGDDERSSKRKPWLFKKKSHGRDRTAGAKV